MHNILNNNLLNKGTAFTEQERKNLNLLGRLPFKVETLDEQVIRAYAQLCSYSNPKHKNIFLHDLYSINQALFYQLATACIEEIVPLIYTPHVATNCQNFSHEFRQPCGLYISYPDQDYIAQILDNRPNSAIDLIVVTDGERILGIGDQGVGGIGIPVGKLMLYTLFGGIDPAKTLPIVLDVGTNNPKLLQDPMYLGWRHPRIAGNEYYNFIDNFIQTLKQKLPSVVLQWEDFGRTNAAPLLAKYRHQICSFNDDIQGTAVVALAAMRAAVEANGQQFSKQRIVILGAGSAAIGIADLISAYTKTNANIWLLDELGLLTEESENIIASQEPYLRKISDISGWDMELTMVGTERAVTDKKNITLLDVVRNVKPTILIGCSTAAGAFTQEIAQEMAKHTTRPIILPLSNPTANCEAHPEDLINWTDGNVLIATGSPFEPIIYKNKKYIISQCNNALAFPGIGLAAITNKSKEINDEMLWSVVETLYQESPILKNPDASLLPLIKDAAQIARKIGNASCENN